MKIIATPDSLRIVDVPLKAKPEQFKMVEAVTQLAMEVPVRVIGDTMVVMDNRPSASKGYFEP